MMGKKICAIFFRMSWQSWKWKVLTRSYQCLPLHPPHLHAVRTTTTTTTYLLYVANIIYFFIVIVGKATKTKSEAQELRELEAMMAL
jgi:hypothetical protein